jgi:hypothetical protein
VNRPFAGITNVMIEGEVQAIEKLCKTEHPNVIQVFDFGKLKEDTEFFFIDMEICETSLHGYLRSDIEVNYKV